MAVSHTRANTHYTLSPQFFDDKIFYERHLMQHEPADLWCDASTVVAIAGDRDSFKTSLYLARRATFMQWLGRDGKVRCKKIDGENNRADVLTKVLTTKVFEKLRHFILNVQQRAQLAVCSAVRVCRFR